MRNRSDTETFAEHGSHGYCAGTLAHNFGTVDPLPHIAIVHLVAVGGDIDVSGIEFHQRLHIGECLVDIVAAQRWQNLERECCGMVGTKEVGYAFVLGGHR